jgi:hypothetical protein
MNALGFLPSSLRSGPNRAGSNVSGSAQYSLIRRPRFKLFRRKEVPHPGAYEASIGTSRAEELAVIIDTFHTLRSIKAADVVEDLTYMQSFLGS